MRQALQVMLRQVFDGVAFERIQRARSDLRNVPGQAGRQRFLGPVHQARLVEVDTVPKERLGGFELITAGTRARRILIVAAAVAFGYTRQLTIAPLAVALESTRGPDSRSH